ncbi:MULTISPECIES: heavy metal translocating P-type ATPase [Halobacterium]|uniref:Cd2+/Zn2+-exporting ATPase n=4 Tax=Halobacterium salinarum TaxID=2242 RepID=A0A4D6GQR9_HALS9|nr:heavy metal translocating P-type ATPase [Halobacterium salinarum]AAG18768.1 zinc-transporting ATPase [Halobacterium salinarum NRC-1]MBB6090812.1 Cd2+/Zn2+-exporting ATPase [Halobacterium salinarum]MDL0123146.1 cation-translocating P-type ATPase [Halobacterium salinarum]MDL0133776.1 cation-translocating P-type ATPase [Halobacterium salinarum]QCC44050.1 P-type transport ATPase (probable substrate zinc/cadmium) [Halobacterium salinarum]
MSSRDHPPGDGLVELRLDVPGMDCSSCAGSVADALDATAGVTAHEEQPTTGSVVVTLDESTATTPDVVAAVEAAGYDVTGTDGDRDTSRADVWTSPRALQTAVGGVFLLAGLALRFFVGDANVVLGVVAGTSLHAADVAFLVAVAAGGFKTLRNGARSARDRRMDIDFLMSIAILGALTASFAFGKPLYFEAATLAVLFSIAELLEGYAMDRARQSLRELMALSPDEATIIDPDGTETTVPADTVSIGDRVAVRPGEKIPADGVVVDGDSAVDQSPVTGESVPESKQPGDEVYAGTVNETGYLEVEVTAAPGDDTLSRIVELVEDAQSNQTDREQFVERFAAKYTPAVVALAVLTTLGSPFVLGVSWPTAVVHGLTLLVLACPCAFVISTPVSVVSAITSAANHGVLVKGGTHLEAMADVDVVAFDKTGTLTAGDLAVTDVRGLNGHRERDVLACARGLEARSEHPIADAIVDAADEAGVDAPSVTDFDSVTGQGVRATLDGQPHFAGKPALFEEHGVDLSHVHATTDGGLRAAQPDCEHADCLDLRADTIPDLQAAGKTVVLVGTADALLGVIAVGDTVRAGAADTVSRLREHGVARTVMLTGDNERTARAVGDEVGVDAVYADCLPAEKASVVADLQDEHGDVAMVGDGINDAPALAAATVGIAMGAAGTDTAIETADVALLGDAITTLPYLYELAGDTNTVIRQNIWASLGLKAALAVGVPFGLVPIWLAVLAGDAGMTLGVTGNALRLGRISP